MALTYAQLKQHVKLQIGGNPSIVAGVSVAQRMAEVINHAGEQLFARQWNFKDRTARDLAVVAAQDYVDLPSDVGEVVSVHSSEGLGWRCRFVTPTEMSDHRASEADDSYAGTVLVCASRPQPTAGAVFPPLRLELWPAPAASSTTGLTVRYRSTWVPVSDATPDEYQIAVPPYAERLLVQYARAFSRSYEDEGLSQLIDEVEAGPVFRAVLERDGMQINDLGTLPRRRGRSFYPDDRRSGLIGDPV